jgi:S-formylglutathione hydrolase
MTLEVVSQARCFDGTQFVYRHASTVTGTNMQFAAFVPAQAEHAKVPVVWFLSGLTCTEENFTVKAGAQRVASELGLMVIAPDTSPRGTDVPDDAAGAYDFGLGAGFYLDATVAPWAQHYRMRTYIESELPTVIGESLPADLTRQSIMGHSMGGHGAMTIALRNPSRFASVSAFAPICAPIRSPWGKKALLGYLGNDPVAWRLYDSCALIEDGARLDGLLVDQGTTDNFLKEQLHPEILDEVCRAAGINLTIRYQQGYDHSYFFIATFVADHLRYHARALGVPTNP